MYNNVLYVLCLYVLLYYIIPQMEKIPTAKSTAVQIPNIETAATAHQNITIGVIICRRVFRDIEKIITRQ